MTEKERDLFIAEKLNEGLSLSDIQKQLQEQFNISLTYMELRMITADLETVDWHSRSPEEEEAEEEEVESNEAAPEGLAINFSKIVRPGCAMSGDVTFSSGAKAEWYLDSYGRLGLDPKGEQEPTQDDLMEFQQELQSQLSNGRQF